MRISLLGMSNVGKSFWAKKLEAEGFQRYCCDDLIEEKLAGQLRKLGYSGIADVGKWMGQPYDPQYEETSRTSLEYEKEVMEEIFAILDKSDSRDVVIDTTGSVIYTGGHILRELAKRTHIVHFETPDSVLKEMLALYIQEPKPVIWGGSFDKKPGEGNLEALHRCYPELLAFRTGQYGRLAQTTMDYFLLRSHRFTAKDLIRSLRRQRRTAKTKLLYQPKDSAIIRLMPDLVIMKFGGTSVGSAERIHTAAKIIAEAKTKHNVVVVTSAMSTVTNLLESVSAHAASKNLARLNHDFDHLQKLHLEAVSDLQLEKAAAALLRTSVEERLAHLRKLLESMYELGELTPRGHDLIISFGERICIHLLSHALAAIGVPANPIEASRLIVTSDDFGNAVPQLEASSRQAKPILSKLLRNGRIPVVTGFIGATPGGVVTTLGRGASDYSATILGYCLDADAVEIWTDVDGVMTADPRIIPEAQTIDSLSYSEAAELSYFGAKVLHPLTMVPAARKNIPIWIKNTFNPQHPGTKISDQIREPESGCKAISTLRNVSLITIQGNGMLGMPGVAGKVFGTVAAANINVLFISQASSEFNISFIVMHHDCEKAVKVLQNAFHQNLTEHTIEAITAQDNLAIIAVVGDGMRGRLGVAGKIFSALGDARVNILAIAQGSSERNISFVISEGELVEAVTSIHQSFGMDKVRPEADAPAPFLRNLSNQSKMSAEAS